MFYSMEMIENLGYETVDDFVSDYIEHHKDSASIFIGWQSDGVFLDYDFDSSKGVPNDGQLALDSIIFPQTIGGITFYSKEELIEWVEKQQELNNILKQEGYLKTQNTCSEKWGVPNYRFKIK